MYCSTTAGKPACTAYLYAILYSLNDNHYYGEKRDHHPSAPRGSDSHHEVFVVCTKLWLWLCVLHIY